MPKRKIATPKLQNGVDAATTIAESEKNKLKSWTIETRPTPEEGEFPFGLNSDLAETPVLEYWNGEVWKTQSGGGGGDINEPGGNNLLIL